MYLMKCHWSTPPIGISSLQICFLRIIQLQGWDSRGWNNANSITNPQVWTTEKLHADTEFPAEKPSSRCAPVGESLSIRLAILHFLENAGPDPVTITSDARMHILAECYMTC